MIFYKILLSYKGTIYKGWQSQTDSGPTIQDTLNKALSQIFKTEEIKTIGSGRTDAGVHAISQVVRIEAPFEIDPKGLLKGLNTHLPNDIRVGKVELSSEKFQPTFDAKKRTYRYYFTKDTVQNPLFDEIIYYHPGKLDIAEMMNSSDVFIGVHDFLDFSCKGSDPKSTIREVFQCEIKTIDDVLDGLARNIYYLEISGNGFLKQMVRAIIGALFDVGRGKLLKKDISQRLSNPQNSNISFVAPAKGLVKYSVEY